MAYIEENELIANRYRLIHKLGSGAYSEVWEAADEKISENPIIALKIYEPELGLDQLFIELFSKEFSNTLNLNHPNILTPKHFDIFQGSPFLILPFCKSGSLKKRIKNFGPLNEESLLKVFSEIGSALCYLHEHQPTLIHQDIKPDNIMINDVNDYLLSDFGISTLWHTTSKFTSGKEFMFTKPYASPEKFGLRPSVSPAIDIFSFAVTIHELVTGAVPWNGEGGLALLKGENIPDLPSGISNEINEFIKKCLSKEPESRPTSKEIITFTKIFIKHHYPAKINTSYPIDSQLTSLEIPKLTYPHNLLTGISKNVRFSWKNVTSAHEYIIQISKDELFTEIFIEKHISNLTFSEIKLDSNSTEYFWRVKAKRENIESQWSENWKFVTLKDNYKTVTHSPGNKGNITQINNFKKFTRSRLYSIVFISLLIVILLYILFINLFTGKSTSSASDKDNTNKSTQTLPINQKKEQLIKTEGPINTTPLVLDSIVFFGSRDDYFYAINYEKRKLKWKFKTEGPIQSSPTKDQSKIYFGSNDRNFYSLFLETGLLAWKISSGDIIESSPVIYQNSVYFGCDNGNLYSVNKENGNLNWKFETKNKIFAKPAIIKDKIFIGSLDSNLYILSLEGILIDTYHAKGRIFSTVDYSENYACFTDDAGFLYKYDINKNDCDIVFDSKSSMFSSPRINESAVYFGNNSGLFFSYNLKTGKLKWNPFKTGNKIITIPIIEKSYVYFGSSDSTFYCLNVSDGKLKKIFKTNGAIQSSPTIHANKVFFGSSDGYLYLLEK